MGEAAGKISPLVLLLALAAGFAAPAQAQKRLPFIFPEQRAVDVRDPSDLPRARIPLTPRPPTVSNPQRDAPEYLLSLDEAIRVSLANSEVVRVLAGVTAVSTGSTIYDPAISNTAIDEQHGRFDPVVSAENSFNRREIPEADFDPMNPGFSRIDGVRSDDYNLNADVSKTTTFGGVLNLGVNANPTRLQPGVFPLNPRNRSSVEMGFTQPLLQGGGLGPNLAPVVLARIDTERSFFQLKDSMQEMVRSVIDAYWALVFARVQVWVREQQVEQSEFVLRRAEAQLKVGTVDVGEVTQARTSYASFRTSLVAAKAELLNREAALRNVLGLPPYDPLQIVPTTQPLENRIEPQWEPLVELAEQQRPDIIELKLILEADEQSLLIARNDALPQLDAFMLYRWNGLEGEMPNGVDLASRSSQFQDWTLGVNFSVPLGLRQARAGLRRQELLIVRDRANLQQGLHSATHILAASLRNLDQFFEQYLALIEARTAAQRNLELQIAVNRSGSANLLVVTQAITDWGTAVINETQSLLQYNAELANLERETGTILEAHGVRFYEERFRSLGPLGRLGHGRLYPSALPPTPNADIRAPADNPSEDAFNLQIPEYRRSRLLPREQLPPPEAPPGTDGQSSLRRFIR